MSWLEQHIPDIVLWVTLLSVLTLVGAIVAVPWVIGRLPVDYFTTQERQALYHQRGISSLLLGLLKNILGLALLLLGLLMLFTPGQGLLTMLLGVLLMNFPGKYHLERAVARRRGVMKALNWMRQRRNLPPLEAPDSTT
ncbi:PGPGW domain-containing protein [Haliea sp. E17]|uniref:PGPGW domain-containing protein n=1 Tax=Haliea sp. E17 TaxID=3401576 RepID=UPI003AB01D19